MALIDSSVWIDYLGGRPGREAALLAERLESGLPVATTGIVIQELLQGLRTDREANLLRRQLTRIRYLPAGRTTHETAARMYRRLRARGITVPSIDALIAAVAVENAVPLLTVDVDHFTALAKVSHLRLVK